MHETLLAERTQNFCLLCSPFVISVVSVVYFHGKNGNVFSE